MLEQGQMPALARFPVAPSASLPFGYDENAIRSSSPRNSRGEADLLRPLQFDTVQFAGVFDGPGSQRHTIFMHQEADDGDDFLFCQAAGAVRRHSADDPAI